MYFITFRPVHFSFRKCPWGLLFITFTPKKLIREELQTCYQFIPQTKLTRVRIINCIIKNDDNELLLLLVLWNSSAWPMDKKKCLGKEFEKLMWILKAPHCQEDHRSPGKSHQASFSLPPPVFLKQYPRLTKSTQCLIW